MNRDVLAFGVLIAGAGLFLIAYTLGKDADELISMRGGYVTTTNMRSAGKGAVLIGLIICLLSLLIP
jgi:NAD(P)H-hydrate repair Nnr-like enzyme with NAD(P)H-hydrate dehydratase domain